MYAVADIPRVERAVVVAATVVAVDGAIAAIACWLCLQCHCRGGGGYCLKLALTPTP